MRFATAAAVVLVIAGPAAAEDAAPAKASKAEVQKVVDAIKADPAKTAQFCALVKLQTQYQALGKDDEKKAEALGKQMDEASKPLGPDFEKVTTSDIDDDSAALLDGLAKTCK